jgi:hypothetical protein
VAQSVIKIGPKQSAGGISKALYKLVAYLNLVSRIINFKVWDHFKGDVVVWNGRGLVNAVEEKAGTFPG